jgi:hypothetical protein
VERWCERKRIAKGAVVSLDQAWELAKVWYHDRMDPGWRRKPLAEAQSVFAEIGLDGEFWRLG